MNSIWNSILSRIDNFYNLSDEEQKLVETELTEFAARNRNEFMEKVKSISPKESSGLFEIYQILSRQPELWIDFIISEFDRIQRLTESRSKSRKSVSSPLSALTYFTNREYNGLDKLINRITIGLNSSSSEIVSLCVELLADIHTSNNLKRQLSNEIIGKLSHNTTGKLNDNAKEIIKDFSTSSSKIRMSDFYPLYTILVFVCGLALSVLSVDYYQNTFIYFSTLIVTFGTSGLLSGLFHILLFDSSQKGRSVVIGFGYGLIFCFLLLFMNFNLADSKTYYEQFPIIEKGTLAPGRHSDCGKPFIVFEREGMTKRIDFSCSEKGIIDNLKMIKLTVKKGFLNFEIIVDKK